MENAKVKETFPCDVCEFVSNTKVRMKKHVICHSSDYQKCLKCDKDFASSKGLILHVAKSHKIPTETEKVVEVNGVAKALTQVSQNPDCKNDITDDSKQLLPKINQVGKKLAKVKVKKHVVKKLSKAVENVVPIIVPAEKGLHNNEDFHNVSIPKPSSFDFWNDGEDDFKLMWLEEMGSPCTSGCHCRRCHPCTKPCCENPAVRSGQCCNPDTLGSCLQPFSPQCFAPCCHHSVQLRDNFMMDRGSLVEKSVKVNLHNPLETETVKIDFMEKYIIDVISENDEETLVESDEDSRKYVPQAYTSISIAKYLDKKLGKISPKFKVPNKVFFKFYVDSSLPPGCRIVHKKTPGSPRVEYFYRSKCGRFFDSKPDLLSYLEDSKKDPKFKHTPLFRNMYRKKQESDTQPGHASNKVSVETDSSKHHISPHTDVTMDTEPTKNIGALRSKADTPWPTLKKGHQKDINKGGSNLSNTAIFLDKNHSLSIPNSKTDDPSTQDSLRLQGGEISTQDSLSFQEKKEIMSNLISKPVKPQRQDITKFSKVTAEPSSHELKRPATIIQYQPSQKLKKPYKMTPPLTNSEDQTNLNQVATKPTGQDHRKTNKMTPDQTQRVPIKMTPSQTLKRPSKMTPEPLTQKPTNSSIMTPKPVGKTCKCEDCDITLSLTDLTKHIVTIHRGQKMNRCTKCKGAGLMNVNSFVQHNSEYHTDKPEPSQGGFVTHKQMTSLEVKKTSTGKYEGLQKTSTAVKLSNSEPFKELNTSNSDLNDSVETLDKIENFLNNSAVSVSESSKNLVNSTSVRGSLMTCQPNAFLSRSTPPTSKTNQKLGNSEKATSKKSRTATKLTTKPLVSSKKRSRTSSRDNFSDVLIKDTDPSHPTSSFNLRLKGRNHKGTRKLLPMGCMINYKRHQLDESTTINDVVKGEILMFKYTRPELYFSISAESDDEEEAIADNDERHPTNSLTLRKKGRDHKGTKLLRPFPPMSNFSKNPIEENMLDLGEQEMEKDTFFKISSIMDCM